MKLLLDTHSLIWFFSGNSKLSETARMLMEDINHQKLISLVSVWEMAIKQSKGKLSLSLPVEDYINQKAELEDYEIIPINLNHLGLVSTLPFYHNDPFDRLLIAQSVVENIPIITKDNAFSAYNIQIIWN